MNQRQAFEAWATTQHIDVTRDGFGGYMSHWTEGALEGWQAAIAQKEAQGDSKPLPPLEAQQEKQGDQHGKS